MGRAPTIGWPLARYRNGQPGQRESGPALRACPTRAIHHGLDESDWLPTEADPEGEAHEDLCLISYDRAAAQAVMRSFFVEGFACEYRCVELSGDLSQMVFQANVVENGPDGLRARETFVFHSDDDLESRFDLASGSGEFKSYTVEHLRRVSD